MDAPLDIERVYNQSIINLNNKNLIAREEADFVKWIIDDKILKNVNDTLKVLWENSIYSKNDTTLQTVTYFSSIPILIFSEPDILWWQTNRNYDLYDMNILDNVAFYNQLKKINNTNVKLILSVDKGYKKGKRHPHSWSIVDSQYLLNWVMKQNQ